MYNGMFTVCDFDAKVLEGREGTAKVAKRYFIVNGQLGVMDQGDEKTDPRIWWATRKDERIQLHFCNGTCFQGYIEAKELLIKEYQTNKENLW